MKKLILLIIAVVIAVTPAPPMFGLFSHDLARDNAMLQEQGAPRAVIGVEFIDIGTPNVAERLQAFTDAGVVPFVNIMIGNVADCPTLQAVNAGACDVVISEFVAGFVRWGGRAYIAPFPEMNGRWVSYGLQPDRYKRAYTRIRAAFYARGVTTSRALFVFAPNAWSESGQEFERYYPGPDLVDAVGISFFSGDCIGGQKTVDDLYQYLRRIKSMAPNKPIYLAQFGVAQDKTAFMDEFMPYLRDFGIAGVLYFSASDGACDFRLDDVAGLGDALEGYTDAPEWDKIFIQARPCRVMIGGRCIKR